MPLKSVTLEKLERMQKEVSTISSRCLGTICNDQLYWSSIQAQEQLKLQESTRTDSEATETSQQ